MTNPSLGLHPTLRLALALHETPGAYTMLLGSGVSRSAQIPTGWDIVQALVRRIASMESDEAAKAATVDAAAWYTTRFGAPPTYSGILEQLAETPAERRELLRPYFEPTAEERAEGIKSPTKAHRSIARLVAGGFIRVILTTNFDQLLETALRDEGVVPVVVSAPDMIQGMMPLQFVPVTVIKLHGDYLDTRIKNTPGELAAYDESVDRLLDRIFDEYGLIVCGWSAMWDDALCAALMRAPGRRFSTFWAARGELTAKAQLLVEQRRAQVIPVESADDFLDTVSEKVAALETLGAPHPLSTAVAVSTLKRYLSSDEYRIRLHDLLQDEANRTIDRITALIPAHRQAKDSLEILSVLPKLEAAAETIIALMALGGYWGDAQHAAEWVSVIERLGNIPSTRAGNILYPYWEQMYRYPAQLAFYAAGLGAVARGKPGEDTLADVMLLPRLREDFKDELLPPVLALNFAEVVGHDLAKQIPGKAGQRAPFSDYLFETLRKPLESIIPDDRAYENAFHRFEYLVALAYADLRRPSDGQLRWAPVGRLAGRQQYSEGARVVNDVTAEIARQGTGWLLLRRGLFAGATDTLAETQKILAELANQIGW